MKLSTKGRYGLRAMTDLAVYGRHNRVSIALIAERQGMSVSYLEHLFSLLKKAGLVHSVKGAQGGYLLACPADKTSIGDILRALEGSITLLEATSEETFASDALSNCIRHIVWDAVDKKMNHFLDSITLEELAEDTRTIEGMCDPMYFI